MWGFLIRTGISALGLYLASELVPGLTISDNTTLFWAAILLGLVNAVVRPVLLVLTFPITIVTLGLFLFVLNATMLAIVAALLSKFTIEGFVPALLGSLVVGFTSWISSWYVGPRGQLQVVTVETRR